MSWASGPAHPEPGPPPTTKGVRFTDFHVSPTCEPGAPSDRRHGSGMASPTPSWSASAWLRGAVTLADALKSAGYATGIFNKMAPGATKRLTGPEGVRGDVHPRGGGIGQTYRAPGPPGNTYFDPVICTAGRSSRQGIAPDVFCAVHALDGHREVPGPIPRVDCLQCPARPPPGASRGTKRAMPAK